MKSGVDEQRARRLATALQQFPRQLASGYRQAMQNAASRWEGRMYRNIGGGGSLRNRTGSLRRSLRTQVKGSTLEDLELRVASVGAPYAKVQEFGTVGAGGKMPDIVPTRAKFLTVPLPDNLTPAGDARYKSAARLRATGQTFLVETKSGNLLIGLDKGDGGRTRWLWILKRSVAIPPRLGFFANWKVGQAEFRRELGIAAKNAVRSLARG